MAQTATAPRNKASRTQPPAKAQPRPWSHGTFHWNELCTRDVEGAKRFYGETIGWTFESMTMPDGGTYWSAYRNGRPVGGIFELTSPAYDGVPENWMPYLAVDDVDARVAKALKSGAKLLKPLIDVPNVGRIAVLMQSGGAGVGWMTPAGDQTGKE
jgi:predicted enzyme related to lactoylglutathione lyase